MWLEDEPQFCVGGMLVGYFDMQSAQIEWMVHKLKEGAQDEGSVKGEEVDKESTW